jgi:hypothetical protein
MANFIGPEQENPAKTKTSMPLSAGTLLPERLMDA